MLLGKRPPWDGVREKSGRTLLVLVRVLWTWHKVAEVKVAEVKVVEVKVVEVKVVDVNLVEVNLVEVEVVASQAGFEFFFIGGGWGQTGSTARRTKASAFGFVVSESAWHLVSGALVLPRCSTEATRQHEPPPFLGNPGPLMSEPIIDDGGGVKVASHQGIKEKQVQV
ncbi:uncharacterized protein UV8b_07811 [Ustilaginoidea virens]|uniref:Uncharacterized protein n=1 Tax=Ustilaginoidea virens TaxID=1159556 RepID=A0A8E5HXQ5_USTVR|nr:uncharacterized protein UV8b_07811 [Ustilaginoidea virens]QUC23570.1 hypothetical protein UV8b_07811 [Ustilaginoidea virens]